MLRTVYSYGDMLYKACEAAELALRDRGKIYCRTRKDYSKFQKYLKKGFILSRLIFFLTYFIFDTNYYRK